jgi:hypothetical protein
MSACLSSRSRSRPSRRFVDDDRCADRGLDALRQVVDAGHLGQQGRDDDEFISAHADHRVLRPDGVAQPLGDDLQQPVAMAVTQRVVDALEVVDVHVDQRDAALRVLRMADHAREARPQVQAVGQAGQRIVLRHVQQLALVGLVLFFRGAPVADIMTHQAKQSAVVVAEFRNGHLGVEFGAVLAAQARLADAATVVRVQQQRLA